MKLNLCVVVLIAAPTLYFADPSFNGFFVTVNSVTEEGDEHIWTISQYDYTGFDDGGGGTYDDVPSDLEWHIVVELWEIKFPDPDELIGVVDEVADDQGGNLTLNGNQYERWDWYYGTPGALIFAGDHDGERNYDSFQFQFDPPGDGLCTYYLKFKPSFTLNGTNWFYGPNKNKNGPCVN